MTSEIRTNSLKSRAGLSTVTMTDSGPMFSGITTFVDNSGFTFGVGGGTSIFTPATNILTLGTNNTEEVRIDANGNTNITGVTTAANFKTGVSNLHNAGLTLTGGQLDVGSNIKIGTAGVVTATSFVGSGANLTGISAGTSLSGSTNNTVCTVTGANAIQGEANLTFNGSTLSVSGAGAFTGNIDLNSDTNKLKIGAGDDFQFFHNGSNNFIETNNGDIRIKTSDSSGNLTFTAGGNTESFRINSSGKVIIGNSGTPFGNAAVQAFIQHGNTAGESGFSSVDTTSVAQGVGGEIAFHGKYNTGAQDWAYFGHIRGIKENATNGNTACALTFHTRPNATAPQERVRITSDGFIGINDTTPYNGLSINKEGDYWDTNGNTYAHPVGRVLSSWRGDRNDNTDYWVGFVGKYMKPSATVNILLQPHVGNFGNQAGMYIAGEATGNYTSDFTLGKIVSGSQAGQGTSGNQRATKSELFRITSGGNVGIQTNDPDYELDLGGTALNQDDGTEYTMRIRSNNGKTAIRVGSGGGGSRVALMRFDGDSNPGNGVGCSGDTNAGAYGGTLVYHGDRSGNENSFAVYMDQGANACLLYTSPSPRDLSTSRMPSSA